MTLAHEKLKIMVAKGAIDKGLFFELCVLDKVERDLASGHLGLDPKMVEVFHRKKYPLPEGKGSVEADVAVELRRKGVLDPMFIIIWECKNLAGKVGRPALQKFHGDVQELGASRVKGIVASPLGFTRWARSYAFKHGIGLWHVVMPRGWVALRSDWTLNPPVSSGGDGAEDLEASGILILLAGFISMLAMLGSKACGGP